MDNLVFTYMTDDGAGFTLGPLTLAVPPGTACALVGRTGSGKTTLTKMLTRAVEPPRGTVRIGGQDVRDTDPGPRARGRSARSPSGNGKTSKHTGATSQRDPAA